ncbi:hypothetical protein REPUB_Repub08aG0051300 [Reevesia pubescens]
MVNTNKIMKTKMNKKFVQQQNDNDQQEEKEISKDSASSNNTKNPSSAKKRGRGGALMEGSRCSRVNGRGWRCCQQTVVGYSLCEYHLGQGWLRRMTSVRNRSLSSSNSSAAKEKQGNNDDRHDQILSNYSSPSQQAKQTKHEFIGESGENGNEEHEDQKPLMMTKKREKLGMVKARSISSLLGQNDNAIATAGDNN